MKQSPILVVDDDTDDLDMIRSAAEHLALERPVLYFHDGNALVEYLTADSEPPFLIICDLMLPGGTGFGLKRRIDSHPGLKFRSVPFLFWSTSVSEKQLQEAYALPAQGFFLKPSDFNELCDTFGTAVKYWGKNLHPKKVS